MISVSVILIACLVFIFLIGYIQYKNWMEFKHEGNGANITRIAMMCSNLAAFIIVTTSFFAPNPFVVAAVILLPVADTIIYWSQFKKTIPILQTITNWVNRLKSK